MTEQRHALEREALTPEQMAATPTIKPNEKGQILFGAWGSPGTGGTGSHVVTDGIFACSGEKTPRGEPTMYAYVSKEDGNPRIKVNCKLCNAMIEKFVQS